MSVSSDGLRRSFESQHIRMGNFGVQAGKAGYHNETAQIGLTCHVPRADLLGGAAQSKTLRPATRLRILYGIYSS